MHMHACVHRGQQGLGGPAGDAGPACICMHTGICMHGELHTWCAHAYGIGVATRVQSESHALVVDLTSRRMVSREHCI